jgi:hypothetical protein
MAGITAEAHAFAAETVFPRLGTVTTTAEVVTALETG